MAKANLLSTQKRAQKLWGFGFVAPVVIFFALFGLFPIFYGTYLSLTSYNLLTPPRYVGLENYRYLLTDTQFLEALKNTLIFVVGATLPVWIASYALALLFDLDFRGRNLLRTIFFTPVLPPLVVVAVVWKILLQPQGFLTGLLSPILGMDEIRWLNDPVLSPLVILVVNAWATIPFFAMIWMAGLSGISNEIRHAATLDGASKPQSAIFVYLPMLRSTFVLVAALSTIQAFQAFILQYEMTPDRGGPGDENLTLGLLVLKYGFEYLRMGDAAAVSVILFVIILLVTALQLRLGRKKW